jgi:hypothetical protein
LRYHRDTTDKADLIVGTGVIFAFSHSISIPNL